MNLEQFLNYTLAFFMWLVLGRAALEFFTRDLNNFFYKFFYQFTEPLYRALQKALSLLSYPLAFGEPFDPKVSCDKTFVRCLTQKGF
jgi:uncharacterized protein YggT (Ycf19 family)